MKLFLFSFLICFPLVGLAQSRDFLSLEYSEVPSQFERSSSVLVGAPPVMLRDVRWLQSVSRRETSLSRLDDLPDTHLRLREYNYSPLFITDLKTGWKMSVGTFLSFRTADTEFLVHEKSARLTGFVTFSPPENDINRLKWFWGFFVPDRSFGVPIFPGVGLEYLTLDEKWRFIVRFPQISVNYIVNSNLELGTYIRYQSSSFYISQKSDLKALGTYIENKSFSAGIMTKYQISQKVSSLLRLGYNLRNQTSILDSDFDQVRGLNESPGFHINFGFGLGL